MQGGDWTEGRGGGRVLGSEDKANMRNIILKVERN